MIPKYRCGSSCTPRLSPYVTIADLRFTQFVQHIIAHKSIVNNSNWKKWRFGSHKIGKIRSVNVHLVGPFCTFEVYFHELTFVSLNSPLGEAYGQNYTTLNLCGNTPTVCNPDSVLCQQHTVESGWSLGSRDTYIIDSLLSNGNIFPPYLSTRANMVYT